MICPVKKIKNKIKTKDKSNPIINNQKQKKKKKKKQSQRS